MGSGSGLIRRREVVRGQLQYVLVRPLNVFSVVGNAGASLGLYGFSRVWSGKVGPGAIVQGVSR